MTALSTERLTQQMGGPSPVPSRLAIPVKGATKIFAGSLVAVQAGYARPATGATGLWVVGKAEATVDNTDGSDGDLTVVVLTGTLSFEMGSSTDAIAQADIGKLCYAIDDQTVGLTSNAGARSAAGIIVGLNGSQVFVLCGVMNPELLRSATIREACFVKAAADGAASTATAETAFYRAPVAGTIIAAYFTPSAALTASDTDYATLSLAKRDGAGGSSAAVASKATNTAGSGSWTAFVPVSLGTISNAALAAGNVLTLAIAKAGSGVAVPSGQLTVVYAPA
jgi:hypothetical protein